MGSPPIPDSPAPSAQDAAAAAASFAPTPPGISVCGFALPGLPAFPPSFALPTIDFGFPPAWALPPLPSICDLVKSIADEVGDGGGRTGDLGLEKDPEYPG